MANTHRRSDLGMAGSMYTKTGEAAITPPDGMVFVAITILQNGTNFDTSGGLIAEDSGKYMNTEAASSAGGGTGGLVCDGQTYYAGTTIYGRWTEIDVNAGGVIAYVGA